jgi:hypothetical protein
MQLGPNIWGPHLWKALHMISVGYPNEPSDEQKKNYRTFFEQLYQIIPCSICSNNYKRHLKELPITDDTMKNRQTLAKWVIEVHNIVNKEHGKPSMEPDDALLLIFNNFESSHEHVEITKKESSKQSNNSYTLGALMVILFILVIIAVAYKKN